MGLILDTNVFVQAERQGRPVDFSQWEEHGLAHISTITVSELLVGVHRADTEARRTTLSALVEAVLAQIPVLDFTTDVARVHAEIFAELSRQGLMIGAHDLIIAATALKHDCAVLTDNTSEFQRVPNLEVIDLLTEP